MRQNAAISARFAAGDLNAIAQLEPTQYIMTVQDPTTPSDTRFLHVLQGADGGAAMVPAAYVQSTTGTAFDGAVFGSVAVYFPVNAAISGVATSLPALAGVHTALVTGLPADSSYNVAVSGNVINISPGAGSTADAAGVLRLTV